MSERPVMDGMELVRRTLAEAAAAHEKTAGIDLAPMNAAVAAIVQCLRGGGKLLVFGNGGSAADAQHVVAELVGRFSRERAAIAALALTTDTSVMTSIANDYTFDRVFARQVEALGRPGDVALGISTSGSSTNVAAALEAAKQRGLRTVAFTGARGGIVGRAGEVHVAVPSDSTARIQEVHRTLLHALCDLVERSLPA